MSARRGTLTVLACAAMLASAASAAADLPAEPRLAWSVSFGGASPVGAPSVRLALDAPQVRFADQRVTLGELDFAGATAALQLAGVPLWQHDYRLAQNGTTAEPQPSQGSPWYTHQWVYWTTAGLAATVALASSAGGNDNTVCTGICNDGGGGGGGGGSNGNVGPVGFNCHGTDCSAAPTCEGTDCVVCPNGDILSSCEGFAATSGADFAVRDVERSRWLDSGTGRMGDLIAR